MTTRRFWVLCLIVASSAQAFVAPNHHAKYPPGAADDTASYSALFASSSSSTKTRFCKAQALLESLVVESKCFSSVTGAREFADACAINVVYEDRFQPQPVVGRLAVQQYMQDKVNQRQGKGQVRLDKISDGDKACGFAWTWVSDNEEGLRGTTFVELNDQGEIHYVQEIPEPIFKPGDLTKDLLKAITADSEPSDASQTTPAVKKTPTVANEIARYLFVDLQTSKDKDEMMRFFDDKIMYHFDFPGITFRPLRFDDGLDSTCFTWELVLDGMDDTIKGISFYELDKQSRKVVYVRDVPESAIKPPILGKLARQLRPGLGVFQGVPLGSRLGGM